MLKKWAAVHSFLISCFFIIFGTYGWSEPPNFTGKIGFPYTTAVANYLMHGERTPIRISGYIKNFAVTGNGWQTLSPIMPDIFEEQPALSNKWRVSATVSADNNSFVIDRKFTSYFDLTYKELAKIDQSDGSYSVITENHPPPSTVYANNFGRLGSMTVYKDKTKAIILCTVTSSYIVEPDSDTSVIYRINEKHYDGSRNMIREYEWRYRIDTAGNFIFVSSDHRDKNNRLHFDTQN